MSVPASISKETTKIMLQDSLKPIVSLCKRRGFIFPGSEIYGGFANTYSYGPYGCELKKNVKDLWWDLFVRQRPDILGMDGPILLHPQVWQASGHLQSFNDALIDCKNCKSRFRVDHLIEDTLGQSVEGKSLQELTQIVQTQIACPKCREKNFTEARHFNLMFPTHRNKTSSQEEEICYLRPETAQAIFLEFKNVLDSMRVKLPFGLAQIGKAFRNEITPGNFIFRTIEFEQMEIEYFLHPSQWEEYFEKWLQQMQSWCELIGLKKEHIHEKEHTPEQLAHYSKRTVDILYDFPFGREELYGLAYRGDFDLMQQAEASKTPLYYHDLEKKEKFIPHVLEPTFGVDRTILALLCEAYEEETLPSGENRTVLHLSPLLAPVKVAVFPLMRKDGLPEKAISIFQELKKLGATEYDDSKAIGKRYRRQDELGTPFCVTVDYESLQDNTVTLRYRDNMEQKRVAIQELIPLLQQALKS